MLGKFIVKSVFEKRITFTNVYYTILLIRVVVSADLEPFCRKSKGKGPVRAIALPT